MLEARRPKGGRMSVVMGAGASGILLHEAMGHAFEADFNRKGQSVFSDKMGGRICRKGINIVDDGTVKASRGACIYDDEGIPGQKTYMVTDGVLTSYLHDRISAGWYRKRKEGVVPLSSDSEDEDDLYGKRNRRKPAGPHRLRETGNLRGQFHQRRSQDWRR